tara:strand:+ start:3498 stop:4412 length:915 start_codon:yes stop_codon:yes gene_type:complete
MLQATIGGYQNTNSNNVFVTSPIYREPGFDILNPFETNISATAKIVYILLSIRTDDTGDNFEAGTADPGSRFTITATNATNGDALTTSVSTNSVNTNWNTSKFNPYVIQVVTGVTVNNRQSFVESFDILIKDSTTSSMITFRVATGTSGAGFHYLNVTNRSENLRAKSSTLGGTGLVKLSKLGSYVLLSPVSAFKEVDKSISEFSYPLNTIYYQREDVVNDEIFDFVISNSEPSLVADDIQVIAIPEFFRGAVLIIDGQLQTDLLDAGTAGFVDIKATSKISNNEDSFRVHLVPTTSGIEIRSL